MATWHYKNNSGAPVLFMLPTVGSGSGALLAPEMTITFQALHDDRINIYPPQPATVSGPEPGTSQTMWVASVSGRVDKLAKPGDAANASQGG